MAELLDLQANRDGRGGLFVLDAGLPFQARRFYFIRDVPPGTERGFHRHRRTRQVLIAVAGACSVFVHDGTAKSEFRLESPELGLVLEPEDWHYMHGFTPDCVLAVLASERYDRGDYIAEAYE